MNTGQFTNEDIILSLIKKATEYEGAENKGIRGKKALHKSLYFLNQTNNIFYFRWADYGPFCVEIQQIVEYVVAGGDVQVNEINTKKEGAVIKNMEISPDSSIEINLPTKIDNTLDEIVRFVADKSPHKLELLASVHFWAVRQQRISDEYSADYIFDILYKLKPDAGFSLDDVKWAIEILETHDFLKR